MSDMADWDWILANDYGRDKMLRSQVDELAAVSASARASRARLSSQLASLQGSLDSRLTALSAAFDAYVELGDVREQLAGYGEEAAVRREVMTAVEALAAGRTAQPVSLEAEGYWLPYAVNAVIALITGTRDRAVEEQARALSREADLFVVVLLGALDRGGLVSDRLPDLLVSDGTLTAAQLVLWRALLAGVYPEPAPGETSLLEAVGVGWRSTLAAGDGSEWRQWAAQHAAGGDGPAQLQWVADLLHGRVLMPLRSPQAGDAAEVGPRDKLRGVAITLIAAGSEAERDLLRRARELRRKIEQPMTGLPPAPDPVEVRSVVRQVFETTTDPARRTVLLGWLQPGLAEAVTAIASLPSSQPERVRRSLPRGAITVGPDGPDADLLAKVKERVREAHPGAASRPLVPAVVAAVLVVLALVGLAGDWSGVLVVLLFIAAAMAGAALAMVRGRHVARQAIEADQRTIDAAVAEATDEAAAREATYRDQEVERKRLVAELRAELGAPEPTSGDEARVATGARIGS